jgi:hypothetical protein
MMLAGASAVRFFGFESREGFGGASMREIVRSAKFWKKRAGSYRIQVIKVNQSVPTPFRGHFGMAAKKRKGHKTMERDDHAGLRRLGFGSVILRAGKGLAGLR